jgi:hypothetical protein
MGLHKFIVSISFFILCTAGSHAQLNESDTLKWQLRLSCNGSWLEGNVKRLLIVNRLELTHARSQWAYNNRTDYQYGTTRQAKTENDVAIYNFVYYKPRKRFYPFVMGIIETNYRRKIKFRYQIGPGVSYCLMQGPNHLLKFSLTGTYESTRFGGRHFNKIADTTSNHIKIIRLTGRIYGRQILIKNKLNFLYELWWQQSLKDKNNYRFYSEETLVLPLSGNFSFRTTFRYTYERIVLRGLKPYDLFWVFGFSISNS